MIKLFLIILFNFSAPKAIELPKLPYAMDALAPHMSEETLQYHYGKHHKAYVDNLNKLIRGTGFENMSLEEIVLKAGPGAIFNNAAQVYNHNMFFYSLNPNPKKAPEGKLAAAIIRDFGSLDALKEEMTKAALGQFGSGWAWLVADKNGKLSVVATSNAENPMTKGLKPLLTIDVWEHAYYIDYRNMRADFVKNVWEIVCWRSVENRYNN